MHPKILKRQRSSIFVAALLLGFAVWSIPVVAQQTRVGGYATTPVTNQEVADAAAFAIKAQEKAGTNTVKLELVEIRGAESQVVAGVNYRLHLKVKQDGRERTAEAVVWWQSWRRPEPYQLTSWTWK
jgi:cystatin-C